MNLTVANEGNIYRKRKYFVPWNKIDVGSDQPVKKIKLGGKDKKLFCSEGRVVVYEPKTGRGAPIDFETKSVKVLAKHPTEATTSCDVIGMSNDLISVVGFYAEPLWSLRARLKRRTKPYNPQGSSNEVTMKIYRYDTIGLFLSTKIKLPGERTTVFHCSVSPNNTFFSLIYLTDSSHNVNCKIFKFTTHFRAFFKACRTFRLGLMSDETEYAFISCFNRTEDLYLIGRKQDNCDYLKESIMVYDIKAKKLMYIPWNSEDADNNRALAFLIQTQNQNLVFVFEHDKVLNVYEINRNKDQMITHIMKINLVEDVGIPQFINALHIHYFANIRVFISTDDSLYVVCPVRKTILKRFNLNLGNVVDQKLTVNWSGEEIYLSNRLTPPLDEDEDEDENEYKILVYCFSENKEKHDTLANLAKRTVLANFTMAKLHNFNLPSTMKALLGVL